MSGRRRSHHTDGRRGAIVAGLVAAIMLPGCGRNDSTPGGAAEPAPREVLERILELRAKRDYQQLRTLIVHPRAGEVITTLIAVDEFLAANDALCALLRQKVGVGVAEMIDQSHLGSTLDIFSRHVELLDERINGQRATVGFLINHEMPARDAHLVRDGSGWRYDPGGGYDPALPEAFRRMAAGLRDTADALRDGRVSLQEIRGNPEKLVAEVALRMGAGVRMLPAPRRDEPGQ